MTKRAGITKEKLIKTREVRAIVDEAVRSSCLSHPTKQANEIIDAYADRIVALFPIN